MEGEKIFSEQGVIARTLGPARRSMRQWKQWEAQANVSDKAKF